MCRKRRKKMDNTRQNNVEGTPLVGVPGPRDNAVKSERKETKQAVKGFPIEIYPESIQELLISLKETQGMPVDFSSAALLFATSIAIGNSCSTGLNQWQPHFCKLYMILIGKPNTNKSGPLKFMLSPLQAMDGVSHEKYRNEMIEYNAFTNLSSQERKEQGGEQPMKPVYKKFLVQDTTIEALKQIVYDNPRGVGVFRDEILGWVNDLNRYNSGSDIQFWLENWSGGIISCDRKGSESIFIHNPFIGVAGTIQPKVLELLAKGERADNGFIDRLLFVYPDNLTKAYWGMDATPSYLIDQYDSGIKELADYTYEVNGITTPRFIPICSTGKRLLLEFLNNRNKPLCDNAPSDALSGSYGKLDLHIFRFILILHRIENVFGGVYREEIHQDTVFRAIQLTEYFRKMTQKAYGVIFDATPEERLPKNKAELYRQLPDRFSTAEGLEEARKLDISNRVFKGMLNDKQLFDKICHGQYSKKY
jgi:hypothetical protein